MNDSVDDRLNSPIWPGELAKMAKLPDLSERVTRIKHVEVSGDAARGRDLDDNSATPSADEPNTQSSSDPWRNRFFSGETTVRLVDGRRVEQEFATRRAGYTYTEERRLAAVMETLRAQGEYRKLAVVGPDWRQRLRKLSADFPTFWEVIDYIGVMYALAEFGTGAIRLDPILLNGVPGSGKSYFAECMSEFIGAGHVCLRMETAQSNSQLAGSSDYWSNSKPGVIFNALVETDYANLVVCFDEIDKTLACPYDPLPSLLCLLEPGTARSFVDQSIPFVTLDASHLTFICTSNEADNLPEYLSSRLRRFDIQLPTLEQGRKLVRRIFKQLCYEAPAIDTVHLTAKAIDALAILSPRLIKRVMREGIGRALYVGRNRLLIGDLRLPGGNVTDEHRIGFI